MDKRENKRTHEQSEKQPDTSKKKTLDNITKTLQTLQLEDNRLEKMESIPSTSKNAAINQNYKNHFKDHKTVHIFNEGENHLIRILQNSVIERISTNMLKNKGAEQSTKNLNKSIERIMCTQNPIQVYLLAYAYKVESDEQLEQLVNNMLDKNIPIFDLYYKFLEEKYNICFEEKIEINMSDTRIRKMINKQKEKANIFFQQMALKLLFPESNELHSEDTPPDEFLEDLEKIGILVKDDKGNLTFIHCTFAEYFAAHSFITKLVKNKLSDFEMNFLLEHIFFKNNCGVIRYFLNNFLSGKYLEEETLKDFGKRLGKLWEENKLISKDNIEDQNTLLHILAKNECGHIDKLICKSLKSGSENYKLISKQLLQKRNDEGKLAWHTAAKYGSVDTLEQLFEWAQDINLENEKMFFALGRVNFDSNCNAWLIASKFNKVEILEKILELGEKLKLTDDEIRQKLLLSTDSNGNNVFHHAIKNGSKKMLEFIVKKAIYFRLNFFDDFYRSTNKDGENALYMAVKERNLKLVKWFLRMTKEMNIPTEQFNFVLNSRTNKGKTVWNQGRMADNSSYTEILLNLLKADIDLDLFEETILQEYNNEVISHEMAMDCDVKVLILIKELYETKNKSLENLLTATNSEGKTVWHFLIGNESEEILKIFINFNEETAIKGIFQEKDTNEYSAWLQAVEYEPKETIIVLFEFAKKQKDESFLRKILMETNNDSKKIVSDNHVLICEWGEYAGLEKADFEKLLLAKDNNGNTILHIICWNGNCQDNFDKVYTRFARHGLNFSEAVIEADNRGFNILFFAAEERKFTVIDKIIHLPNQLKDSRCFLTELLFQKTKLRNESLLHFAVETDLPDLIDKVFEIVKIVNLNKDAFKDFVKARDKKQRSLLHFVGCKSSLKMKEKIFELYQKAGFTLKELHDELNSTDDSEANAIHYWIKNNSQISNEISSFTIYNDLLEKYYPNSAILTNEWLEIKPK